MLVDHKTSKKSLILTKDPYKYWKKDYDLDIDSDFLGNKFDKLSK